MIVIFKDGKFKTESIVPKVWNNVQNYRNADPSVWYADGWREPIYPPYDTITQKLGDLKWVDDIVNGEVTFEVIDLPDEEVRQRLINNAKSQKEQFTRVKIEKQVETELQALTDDADILENQAGYPLWSDFPDQYPFGPNDKVQDFEGNELKVFKIIQPHNKQGDRVPVFSPALWTKIEFSGGVEVWAQPIGGDGKYPSIDPSTGELYQVTHNGLIWENTHPAPSLNVWEPGVFGWTQVV